MNIEDYGGSFPHRYSWIAGYTGEIAPTVCVNWCDGQVAPGRNPFPVWQHFLFDKEKGRDRARISRVDDRIRGI